MKKIICLSSLLFLSGCLARPSYYPSTQDINFEKSFNIKDAVGSYQNNTFESSETVSVKRSYSDKELIIKKEGFKDYHLKLTSQWTDEKWGYLHSIMGDGHNISAGYLFLPLNTLACIEGIPVMGIGLLFLPWGISSDIYNIFIGAPSTAIINPWRKFVFENKILLEPTEEFTKECHKNKNAFISNWGCTECDMWDEVVSSEDECNRCPDRTYYTVRQVCAFPKLHEVLKNADTQRLVTFYNNEYKRDVNRAYRILDGLKENERQDVISIINPCIETDKPIKDVNGMCHSCWEKEDITVDREYYGSECHTQRLEFENISRLNPCSELYIVDKDMKCRSYDEDADIQMPQTLSERTKKLMCEKYCEGIKYPHNQDECRHLNEDGICIKGLGQKILE